MSTLPALLSPEAVKSAASLGAVSAVQSVASGTIQVNDLVYTGIAAALGLAGVFMARLVTIGDENRKLGRIQTWRETGPLTWIGVLIVCPFIWHFDIAIPWASMIGLGVGYSVKIVLKVFGGGAVNAARILARRAADALDEENDVGSPALDAPGAKRPAVILPPTDAPTDQAALLEQLRSVPSTLPPTGKNG